MSNFKIVGNSNPEIGKEIVYTIENLNNNLIPERAQFNENIFQEQIHWSIFILEYGKWYKKEKNNKTGSKAVYTFTQKSLARKGIRIVAQMGEHKATLDIIPQHTIERKIIAVELCNAEGKKQTEPFSYGQAVIARVHCTNLNNCTVHVTLWEDDAPGAGHDEINLNNKAVTKSELISNGIADVKFKLDPAFSKIANLQLGNYDKDEGKYHEYYVTAEIFRNKKASSDNINVKNPDKITENPAPPKRKAPADSKEKSKKEIKGINKFENKLHDYFETTVSVKSDFGFDPVEKINSLLTLNVDDKWWEKKEDNCGQKYCIKKGDKNELIREINIRLAGFGGNVPTDEFTDRTEKMIRQFQRDYMTVQETGKICGNVLRAIDEFQEKYTIHFDDIKCKCGKCNGFGNGKFQENKQNNNILEAYRKYEYPGIHRSLVWSLRAVMFYSSIKVKQLGYSVKCIASGYRCDEDNKQHRRNTTNHMGKALDLHFNKNGKRTQKRPDIILEMEEIRLKIFNKYLGAKWDWKIGQQNIFNLESTAYGAKTWVHFDVREYDLQYLKDDYFATTINDLNGQSIVQLAMKTNTNTCNCIGSGTTASQFPLITQVFQSNDFNVDDGKKALKIIYDKYGKDMAVIIERMYRDETAHFSSGQYKACGTGGMESFGNAPYYGWDHFFFEEYPEYKPLGLWNAFENKGMSGLGGNQQVTDKKKSFVILPSVIAGMEYKAFYINKYNGNWARWTSTNSSVQETYKKYISTITAKFVNEFELINRL
jgi:hypothetical protein